MRSSSACRRTFDLLASCENGLDPLDVDVCGRETVDPLMVARVIVLLDKGACLPFEIAQSINC